MVYPWRKFDEDLLTIHKIPLVDRMISIAEDIWMFQCQTDKNDVRQAIIISCLERADGQVVSALVFDPDKGRLTVISRCPQ